MADFEMNPSRGRRDGSRRNGPQRDSRGSPRRDSRGRDGPRRDSGGRGGFGNKPRFGDRGPRREKNFEMTKVTCSECKKDCEVPFKPKTDKPVFCSECFESKGNGKSNGNSGKDLRIINEKLDKIMTALKIE